jgi:hypothetical protein
MQLQQKKQRLILYLGMMKKKKCNMALTYEEQQIVNAGIQAGKSPDDVKRALEKYRGSSQYTQAATDREASLESMSLDQRAARASESYLQDAQIDTYETVAGIKGELMGAGERIVERYTSDDPNLLKKGLGMAGDVVKGGSRAIGEGLLGMAKFVAPESVERGVAQGAEAIGQKIGETETMQGLVSWYNELDEKDQDSVNIALSYVEGLADILTLKGSSKVMKAGIGKAKSAVGETIESTIKKTDKLREKITPKSVVVLERTLDPVNAAKALDIRTKTYKDAFVQDKSAVNNKLDDLAKRQSRPGQEVTADDVIQNFAKEGYTPKVDGKLAKFDHVFEDIKIQQTKLIDESNAILKGVNAPTNLADFKARVMREVQGSDITNANFLQINQEIDRIMANYAAKWGPKGRNGAFNTDLNKVALTPQQLNQIRVDMNNLTRAFDDSERFIQDAADSIADAARARTDEIVPGGKVAELNEEWGRLQDLKKTAKVFHNRPIDIGILGSAVGRYAGAATVGGGLATGSGSLVIAGLFAHLGGEAMGKLLRAHKFNPNVTRQIQVEFSKDPELVKRLIAEAAQEDKGLVSQFLTGTKEAIESTGRAVEGGVEGVGTAVIAGPGMQQEDIIQGGIDAAEEALLEGEAETGALTPDNFAERIGVEPERINPDTGEIIDPTPEEKELFDMLFSTTEGKKKR